MSDEKLAPGLPLDIAPERMLQHAALFTSEQTSVFASSKMLACR